MQHDDAFAMQQPQNIGVVESRQVGIVQVKPQHVLKQPDGFDLWRLGVGRMRLPGEKLVEWPEKGIARLHLEGVLRLGCSEFSGCIKV